MNGNKFDYIICMEGRNIRNIKRIIGSDIDNKIYRLLDFTSNPRDIADPWYTGNFDIAYNDILEGCKAWLDKLHMDILEEEFAGDYIRNKNLK